MVKEFCDLCGDEVTGKQSGSVHGGDDCDADGNGTMNDHWDILCLACYRKFKAFMASLKPKPKARTTHG